MKIRHNVPINQKSDPITPEYQAEVDASMERGRIAYERAQRRLEKAEQRLTKAQSQRVARSSRTKHQRLIAELEAIVELRRLELERTHRMMVATGAPSTSHGKKSHRHINVSHPPL